MQEHLYPAVPDTQNSDVPQRLVSQSSVLHVLTQLTEQLLALEDEGRAPAWHERLLTTLQGQMTETHAEIQEIHAALVQLAPREDQP